MEYCPTLSRFLSVKLPSRPVNAKITTSIVGTIIKTAIHTRYGKAADFIFMVSSLLLRFRLRSDIFVHFIAEGRVVAKHSGIF